MGWIYHLELVQERELLIILHFNFSTRWNHEIIAQNDEKRTSTRNDKHQTTRSKLRLINVKYNFVTITRKSKDCTFSLVENKLTSKPTSTETVRDGETHDSPMVTFCDQSKHISVTYEHARTFGILSQSAHVVKFNRQAVTFFDISQTNLYRILCRVERNFETRRKRNAVNALARLIWQWNWDRRSKKTGYRNSKLLCFNRTAVT